LDYEEAHKREFKSQAQHLLILQPEKMGYHSFWSLNKELRHGV